MKEFFDTIDFTIAAGAQRRIERFSNFVTVLESTSSDFLQVGLGQQYRGKLVKGISIEMPKDEVFTHVMFYNPTASAMTVRVAFSEGRIYDNRVVLSGTLPVELLGDTAPEDDTYAAGFDEVAVGLAAVNVLPANTERKGGSIQAKSTNAGLIYLGFTNAVTTAMWFVELQAGQPFSIDNYRGDIYAIASLAAQAVGVGEW